MLIHSAAAFEICVWYYMKAIISNCCVVFFQKHTPHFNYQFPQRLELSPPIAINNAVMNTALISSQNPVETCPPGCVFQGLFPGSIKSASFGPCPDLRHQRVQGWSWVLGLVDAPGDGDVHAWVWEPLPHAWLFWALPDGAERPLRLCCQRGCGVLSDGSLVITHLCM